MADSYDLNFCYPVPAALENDRVKLVPFIPSTHGPEFYDLSQKYPETFKFLAYGPFRTETELYDDYLEKEIRQDPGRILFAIFDKTKVSIARPEGAMAGAVAYIFSFPSHLATEIGCVKILPPFQRTHVASNVVGLLLKYALDLPSEGGLGLRRVVWQANVFNEPSVRLAERMGFVFEGVARWGRALPPGKEEAANGKGIRAGDPLPEYVGRDDKILSFCWDDWVNGGKEHVEAVMSRIK